MRPHETLTSAMNYFRFGRVSGGIDALDGLRAFAVLLVLFRHAIFPVSAGNDAPVWPFANYDLATPFINGWIGVDLFFILSGFLIGGHLMRKNAETFLWRNYLLQRALRIVPTYWFVLTIVICGFIPFYTVNDQFLFIRTAYHVLFLQDYLPPNIVVAFWSLGVEEKFYLLSPLLVFGSSRVHSTGLRTALLMSVALLAILSRSLLAMQSPEHISYAEFVSAYRFPFHHCIDTLIIGVVMALLFRELKATGRNLSHLADALAWGGLGLISWLLCANEILSTITWWDKTLQPTFIGLAFGSIVLGCALGGGPQRVLSCLALRITARISYPLYLIHMTLIPLCWNLVDGGGLFAFVAVFFAISFLMAVAIHFSVEKPFLLMKDHLQARTRASWPHQHQIIA